MRQAFGMSIMSPKDLLLKPPWYDIGKMNCLDMDFMSYDPMIISGV